MRRALVDLRARISSNGQGLASDLGWGLAFELMVLVGALVTFLLLARDLGPAEYGYYAAIQGFISVLSPLVAGWSGFVLLEDTIRDKSDVQRTWRSLTTAVAVCSAAVLLITVCVAHPLLPKVAVTTTMAFVAAEVVGNALVQTSSAMIQAVHGFASSTRARLVLLACQTILVVGLWADRQLTLTSVAIGTLMINVSIGVAVLVLCMRACQVGLGFLRPSGQQLRRGGLYAVVLLCFAVEEDADKTLLVEYRFDRTAGVYAAAYRVVQLGLLPLRVMISATHQRFLEHDPEAVGQHWRRSKRFTVPAAIYGVVAVAGFELAAPLLPDVLGSSYSGTTTMVRFLAVLVLFRSLTSFAFNGLMGLGKRAWRTTVLGVSAGANLVLNLALIPLISWRGCVIATIVGETLYLVLTWYGLRRFQREQDAAVLASRETGQVR